ncbi:methyltransferase domain-containing protein [Aquisalimonas sp.]|uniref:methyltransferase domain-containing protein n=1 Tax=Aquisalimonas sp. TaxID=1872621 RepID=UPI0025B9A66B|nr:methyltransferase domain-containing protein [Aquisalimonas sp.]
MSATEERSGVPTEVELFAMPGEDYMSREQLEYFRQLLLAQRRELLEAADASIGELRRRPALADEVDRASSEEEFNVLPADLTDHDGNPGRNVVKCNCVPVSGKPLKCARPMLTLPEPSPDPWWIHGCTRYARGQPRLPMTGALMTALWKNTPSINVYSERAEAFFRQYESIRFEDVHGHWRHCIPSEAGCALDVGSGSGRDARALAALGWRVTAVEPADALRRLAASENGPKGVQWVDSALPRLEGVASSGDGYGLILLSAVWMHLPPASRSQAMTRLSGLLAPSGRLVITLRHGPATDDRTFYPCDRRELDVLALTCGLVPCFEASVGDRLGRGEVSWETVVLVRR